MLRSSVSLIGLIAGIFLDSTSNTAESYSIEHVRRQYDALTTPADKNAPSTTPSIEQFIEMYKNATDEPPIIEKNVTSVDGKLLLVDAKYIEAMEEVMQLWWSQRGQFFNVKFEKTEVEREGGLRLPQMDPILNKTEELIEDECKTVWNILWGDETRDTKHYRHPLNRTAIDKLQNLWKEVENCFNECHVRGPDLEIKNFRYELKYAQDDLPRRYKKLEELMIELQTRTPKPEDKEDEEDILE